MAGDDIERVRRLCNQRRWVDQEQCPQAGQAALGYPNWSGLGRWRSK